MREALQKGRLGISALSPRVTTGKEQWQEWHHDFFHNQMQDFIQDDVELHARADEMNTDLEVITLREASQTALEVRPSKPALRCQMYFRASQCCIQRQLRWRLFKCVLQHPRRRLQRASG